MNEKYETLEKAIAAWNNEDLTLFLMKSKHSMPVGTLREFGGVQYRKIAVGNWQPVHKETAEEKDSNGQVKHTTPKPVDKKPEEKKSHITINIKDENKYKQLLETERGLSEKQMHLIAELEKKGIKNYKEHEKYKELEKEKEKITQEIESLKVKSKNADKK